jgi:PAS domain S-box-containing protein
MVRFNMRVTVLNTNVKGLSFFKLDEEMVNVYNSFPLPTFAWQLIEDEFYLIFFNQHAVKLTRGGISKFLYQKISNFLPIPDFDPYLFTACIREKSCLEKDIEYKMRSTNELKNFRITLVPYKDNIVIVHALDVTNEKRLNRILTKANERINNILLSLADDLFIINYNGNIIISNSKNQIHNIYDIFSPEIKKKFFHSLLQSINNKSQNSFSYFEPTLNKHYEIKITPAEDDTLIVHIRDLTDFINANFKYKQFLSIWDNSIDGMRITGKDGKIIAVNKNYCDMVGLPCNDLIGQLFYTGLNKNYDEAKIVNNYRMKFNTNSNLVDKLVLIIDEKKRYFYVINSIINSSDIRGDKLMLSIFKDVTKLIISQKKLNLIRGNKGIGKMSAYLAHEIKTPMTSIRMNLDLLGKTLKMDTIQERSFAILNDEMSRLYKIIKDVLQFSNETKASFSVVNLFSLIDNIKNLLEPLLTSREIEFINNVEGIEITGDDKGLKTLFMQLIENSIEAINSNGIIEISSISQKNYFIIRIKDTGCGITNKENIFIPFKTTKTFGTGLGLPIAKRIAASHCGLINLVSETRGDTIFEVKFNRNNGNDSCS